MFSPTTSLFVLSLILIIIMAFLKHHHYLVQAIQGCWYGAAAHWTCSFSNHLSSWVKEHTARLPFWSIAKFSLTGSPPGDGTATSTSCANNEKLSVMPSKSKRFSNSPIAYMTTLLNQNLWDSRGHSNYQFWIDYCFFPLCNNLFSYWLTCCFFK